MKRVLCVYICGLKMHRCFEHPMIDLVSTGGVLDSRASGWQGKRTPREAPREARAGQREGNTD